MTFIGKEFFPFFLANMVVTSILLVSSTVLRNKGISGNFSFILLQNICHIFGENNEIVEHETGRIFKILAISC